MITFSHSYKQIQFNIIYIMRTYGYAYGDLAAWSASYPLRALNRAACRGDEASEKKKTEDLD
ncbi:hypothetical protein ALQ24_200075 [Pseudomonas syringae pv. antirrhini]|nr:hypothetical protein ALQ24_200075 [Pseudomonas syringae pv. antirrhini]